jgi:alpha-tubulin suppressor-like RCC1 family protein
MGGTWQQTTWGESPIAGAGTITRIAAGHGHGYALDDRGTLYSVGRNNKGQLGRMGTRKQSTWGESTIEGAGTITRIAAGHRHGYALDDRGTLYNVGLNNHGQLGLGDTSNRSEWAELSDPFAESQP